MADMFQHLIDAYKARAKQHRTIYEMIGGPTHAMKATLFEEMAVVTREAQQSYRTATNPNTTLSEY